MPWTSMHAGSGRSSPMMALRLGGADLEPGDTVTFVYGDRSRGSRGFAVQTHVDPSLRSSGLRRPRRRRQVLLAGLGLTRGRRRARGRFARRLRAVGGGARRALHARDPSRRPLVQSADRRDPGMGGATRRQAGRDGAGRRVARSRRWPGWRCAQPGVHRFEVRSADGRLSARSNPIWVRESGKRSASCGASSTATPTSPRRRERPRSTTSTAPRTRASTSWR